jgi:hypothetical protein
VSTAIPSSNAHRNKLLLLMVPTDLSSGMFFMTWHCDNALCNMYSLLSLSTCLVLKGHFCPCMLRKLHMGIEETLYLHSVITYNTGIL